jgi:hypothetical protein
MHSSSAVHGSICQHFWRRGILMLDGIYQDLSALLAARHVDMEGGRGRFGSARSDQLVQEQKQTQPEPAPAGTARRRHTQRLHAPSPRSSTFSGTTPPLIGVPDFGHCLSAATHVLVSSVAESNCSSIASELWVVRGAPHCNGAGGLAAHLPHTFGNSSLTESRAASKSHPYLAETVIK